MANRPQAGRQPVQGRPKTIREVQAEKQQEVQQGRQTILNISHQLIKIHLRAPKKVDFYYGAQDISLRPGQSFAFPKSRLWAGQIERLRKQRQVSVVSDSEKQ